MILGILQARSSSSRLPNKVLLPLLGEPMLARQIERVKRSQRIDHLVLATSDGAGDDAIANLCAKSNVTCFRGSLQDVLDRYYQAARPWRPEHVVRLTGDCPLADPEVIDQVIQAHLDSGADYTSNTIRPTFPDGLDVEVCKFDVLEQAWSQAELLSQREHVTLFIHKQPERFRLMNVTANADRSAMRWTVDNPEDFAFVNAVYSLLYPINPRFTTADVLDLLDSKPELALINRHLERNIGLKLSLQAEQSER